MKKQAFAVLGIMAATAAFMAFKKAAEKVEFAEDEEPQTTDAPGINFNPYSSFQDLMTPTNPQTQSANMTAFLMTIRAAEGTAGQNGYRMLFGGKLFDSFEDHPRQAKLFRTQDGRLLYTSAAGAYQFMAVSPTPTGTTRVNTWDRIAKRLGLPDFGPDSQDAAAVELIREAGGLGDVTAGRFDAAINKVRGIWASLPGAGYSQPERTLSALRETYLTAGGEFA